MTDSKAFSDEQLAQLRALMTELIRTSTGPGSEIRQLVDKNTEAIQVLQRKVDNLVKENKELRSELNQRFKAEKEVIVASGSFNPKVKDLKKSVIQNMKKIDAALNDRDVVKCVVFGKEEPKRLSVIMLSNEARNRFIDCVVTQNIKGYSKGRTQSERKRNKEVFLLHTEAREINKKETDANHFTHITRTKEGKLELKRSSINNTRVKKEYEAYLIDRERHNY